MTWQPHVTVATIVEREGKFLLVRELINGDIRLNQPAGHLEAGESLHQAALRETLEETGWTVALTGVIGIDLYTSPSNGITYVRTSFIARALSHDSARPLDTGIIDALWLSRDDVAARADSLRSPKVLEVIDHYLTGRQFPLEVVGTDR
ncbi:MAG TPA: NUDIX hydrolase [Cellvibrionaceae bacterium]